MNSTAKKGWIKVISGPQNLQRSGSFWIISVSVALSLSDTIRTSKTRTGSQWCACFYVPFHGYQITQLDMTKACGAINSFMIFSIDVLANKEANWRQVQRSAVHLRQFYGFQFMSMVACCIFLVKISLLEHVIRQIRLPRIDHAHKNDKHLIVRLPSLYRRISIHWFKCSWLRYDESNMSDIEVNVTDQHISDLLICSAKLPPVMICHRLCVRRLRLHWDSSRINWRQ